jgi:two-component system, chemotaxis family, chemotaxis protein CheY
MAKKILAVDDSASMRQMIRLTLRGAGYEVIEAGDGQEGLAQAKAGSPHMILTDLNMPVMDGMTFIKELRKQGVLAGIPIVFVTTESDAEKKSQAKAAGATAWITKPFQPEQLVAVAKKVLGE